MKALLSLFFLFFFSFLCYSQDSDSISIDSSYRLIDINGTRKRDDKNIQFTRKDPVHPKRFRRPPSGGHHPIGGNYESTQNVDPKVASIVSVCFLLFILFFIYRVRRSLKKDKTK